MVDAVVAEPQFADRNGEREVLADPGGSFATFTVYLPPIGAGSLPYTYPVRLAALSISVRLRSFGPTRRSTVASLIVSLPRLVTVPETVRVSPLTGALGASVSRATSTVSDLVGALPVPPACAAGAVGPASSAATSGAPMIRAAVRRSHRRAGEGPIP